MAMARRRVLRHERTLRADEKAAPKSGFLVHEDHRFHARPRGQTVLRRANGPRKLGWAEKLANRKPLKSSNAGQRRSHEAQNAAPNDAEEQDPSDERGLHARLLIWVSARTVASASLIAS